MRIRVLPDSTVDTAAPRATTRLRARRLSLLVLLLVACWVIPAVTHVLGLDLVLPIGILVLVASLVRGGRTVLDQLVVAAVMVFGVTCLAAVVFTVWPWGLQPTPVAGTALTALVLLAAATSRRPRFDRRFARADVFVVAAVAGLVLVTVRQFALRDLAGRLGLVAANDDFARHILLTDAIGQVGGYAFMRTDQVARFMDAGYGLEQYPQGWHVTVALLDRFWRSSGVGNAHAAATADTVVWSLVATFVVFGAAALWTVRRLAGPEGSGWTSMAVLGATLAYVFFADPVRLLVGGFPNELAGLAGFVVLIGLVARPLHRTPDQLMAVACALVTIGFTYYLFLPSAGLLALAWLWRCRTRVVRHRLVLLLSIAVAGAACVPVVVNLGSNVGTKVLLPGAVPATDRHVLLALLLAVAAGLLTRRALRSWAWRTVVIATAVSVLLTAVVGAYQLATVGRTLYYYERALHLVMVSVMVGIAATTRLAPRVSLPPGSGWRRRAQTLAPLVALTLAPFALFGIVLDPTSPAGGGSYGTGLVRGRVGFDRGTLRSALWASHAFPGTDRVVVDLTSTNWANAYNTLYGSVLRRDYGSTVSWYLFLYPTKGPKTIDDLERAVLRSTKPVLFLVADPQARFLVSDSAQTPLNRVDRPRSDTGDERAMTNVAAAQYLAGRYPGRVTVQWER